MANRSKRQLPTRPGYKLRDLQAREGVQLDLWSLEAPPQTYEANACGAMVEARELALIFGQKPPGVSKPATAISIGMPISDAKIQMASFERIKQRLRDQNFTQNEENFYGFDTSRLEELTDHSYRRFAAELIRSSCNDSTAVLDFYKRPIIPQEVIAARPDDPLELAPAVRVVFPAAALSLLLRLAGELLQEVQS